MMKTQSQGRILIVEDDFTTLRILSVFCSRQGFEPLECSSSADALRLIEEPVVAIILDLGLPDGDGLELLREVLREKPWMPCFVLTARDSARLAVECIKAGARDYCTKPVDLPSLFTAISSEVKRLNLVAPGAADSASASLMGSDWPSEAGRESHALALNASASDQAVLITGEPGTGKVKLAGLIHQASMSAKGPFRILRIGDPGMECAETALFGTAGGVGENPIRGEFQRCAGGTLLIDGLENLSQPLQAKLAEVVAKGEFHQQGSQMVFAVSCRIICTSSVDVAGEAAADRFSKKLWFSLKPMHIPLMPLRRRIEDLSQFCEKFITDFCVAAKRPRLSISVSAMEALLQYDWPGNLDELRHCVETACRNCDGSVIGAADFPAYLWDPGKRAEGSSPLVVGSARIDEMERASLVSALTLCKGNRRLAAQRLGVSLRTVYNMLQRYNLGGRQARIFKSP